MYPPLRAHARSARCLFGLGRKFVYSLAVVLIVSLVCDSAFAQSASTGTISGQVFDGVSGVPLENATVILVYPEPGDGSEPDQALATSGPSGDFEFDAVPSGIYSLSFVKSGYRASSLTDFEVVGGQDNKADFPMPPQTAVAGGDVLELDAFVVEASVVGDLMNNMELRLESDQMVNLLSAEDLSKYAATDVADALKRVAGVNIVEGQFAIIRGLEDRYSSTLFNGAPIPSPDPDRQSVQLDLFPSEIVGNLVVAKTFGGELPSNSSGGSIDIVTNSYPEEITATIKLGMGFNDRALDRFLRTSDRSAVGVSLDPDDVIESEVGLSLAGRKEFAEREFRFKAVLNRDYDFKTAEGNQEAREPDRGRTGGRRGNITVQEVGDLALGILSLSRGRFDLTQSEEIRQHTAFVGAGMDLDEAGNHKIDASALYVAKENEIAQRREGGYIPNLDYGPLLASGVENVIFADVEEFMTQGSPLNQFREEQDPADGIAFYTVLDEHRTFTSTRDLFVGQLNGEHLFEELDGLEVDWAWNYSKAKQKQEAYAAQIFFEPDDPVGQTPDRVPTTVDALRPGVFAVNNRGVQYNRNEIEEEQHFARIDLEYERELFRDLDMTLRGGLWYENSERDVDTSFAVSSRFPGPVNSALTGATPRVVGSQVFGAARYNDPNTPSDVNTTETDLSREIGAIHLGAKATLWEDLDLQGSVRLEDLEIKSENDPFTGQVVDGSPITFPSKYVYCDRLDNPALPDEGVTSVPTGVVFNDQIIGIDSPVDANGILDRRSRSEIEDCINGLIDEQKALPGASIAYRPSFRVGEVKIPGLGFLEGFNLDGMTFRAAYSQTVARPSFRELSYYVTTEPGTDDQILGNPQLGLSDVESWDLRAEYVFGDLGDLIAVSLFKKTIEDPIEVIVLRDARDATSGTGTGNYRTFFNNPSDADLNGIEAEARFHLGFNGAFGPVSDIFDLFSLGGNYTYIDAEVSRSQAEIDRTDLFFIAEPGTARFQDYKRKRRLFGQPEWIANADLSFNYPEWGTRFTLAYFAISEVLDAAGSVALNANNEVVSFEPDRYTDEFYQLDLIASQDFEIPKVPGIWTLSGSVKNVTDTTRKIIYDQRQTGNDISERSFKVGRDYSFSLQYQFEF